MPDYQRESQQEERDRRKRIRRYLDDEEEEPFRMTTGNSLRFPDEDD